MSKPPILAIHGMWSVPAAFDVLRDALASAGYGLQAAEYRAGAVARTGSLARVGLADYVQSCADIAAALPVAPVLLGHSMGGLVAQLLACKIQPRALVLLATAPAHGAVAVPSWSSSRATWSVLSRWGFWRQETLLSRSDALYGVYNHVSAEEAAAGIAQLVPDSGRVLTQIAFSAFDSAKAAVVDYAAITCPTLVLCGAHDRITPTAISRATARRIAGPVAYQEIDDIGHWLVGIDASPRVASTIAAFLGAHGI
jgi:pimeloyl-ACP methyl ester carboxylesterase